MVITLLLHTHTSAITIFELKEKGILVSLLK